MFLTVNHSEGNNNNNEKKEFQTIKEGKYQAIISEASITKSKTSGNDMIKVTLTIRDDVNQEFGKRKVWDYIVDSEKAKWKLQQVAKAVNIPNGKSINTIQEFAQAIIYKPVTIEIKNEENTYNGETKVDAKVSVYTVAEVATNSAPTDPFSF